MATRDSNETGLYRTRFDVPATWEGMRVFLHFDGVQSAFSLWVNGESVGYSEGSMTPAEFGVTNHVHPGENLLAAEVIRWSDGSGDLLNASVHNHTLQNLTAAEHTYDLEEADHVVLNVDLAQAGLGSEPFVSSVLPEYVLDEPTYRLRYGMRAIDLGGDDLEALLAYEPPDGPEGEEKSIR